LKGLSLSIIESGMDINDIVIHTNDKASELNANEFDAFMELYQSNEDTVNFDNIEDYQVNNPGEISFKSLNNWKIFSKIENTIVGEIEIEKIKNFLLSKNLGLDQIYLCQMEYEVWSRPISDMNFFKQYLPTLAIPESTIDIKSEPTNWMELDLKCIIVSNGKTFRSKCVAFNSKALKLHGEISEHFLNCEIEVFINSPDMKVNIKIAAVIENAISSEFILNLINPSDEHVEFINRWLIDPKEQVKRSA
jgi:hypothetical protein